MLWRSKVYGWPVCICGWGGGGVGGRKSTGVVISHSL